MVAPETMQSPTSTASAARSGPDLLVVSPGFKRHPTRAALDATRAWTADAGPAADLWTNDGPGHANAPPAGRSWGRGRVGEGVTAATRRPSRVLVSRRSGELGLRLHQAEARGISGGRSIAGLLVVRPSRRGAGTCRRLPVGLACLVRSCRRQDHATGRPPRKGPTGQPSRDLRHFATDGADPGRELPQDRYEALPDR